MARIHRLKVWPPFFEQVSHGLKTFEVRKDDRGYAEGDFLVLDECHKTGVYTREQPTKAVMCSHCNEQEPAGKLRPCPKDSEKYCGCGVLCRMNCRSTVLLGVPE